MFAKDSIFALPWFKKYTTVSWQVSNVVGVHDSRFATYLYRSFSFWFFD